MSPAVETSAAVETISPKMNRAVETSAAVGTSPKMSPAVETNNAAVGTSLKMSPAVETNSAAEGTSREMSSAVEPSPAASSPTYEMSPVSMVTSPAGSNPVVVTPNKTAISADPVAQQQQLIDQLQKLTELLELKKQLKELQAAQSANPPPAHPGCLDNVETQPMDLASMVTVPPEVEVVPEPTAPEVTAAKPVSAALALKRLFAKNMEEKRAAKRAKDSNEAKAPDQEELKEEPIMQPPVPTPVRSRTATAPRVFGSDEDIARALAEFDDSEDERATENYSLEFEDDYGATSDEEEAPLVEQDPELASVSLSIPGTSADEDEERAPVGDAGDEDEEGAPIGDAGDEAEKAEPASTWQAEEELAKRKPASDSDADSAIESILKKAAKASSPSPAKSGGKSSKKSVAAVCPAIPKAKPVKKTARAEGKSEAEMKEIARVCPSPYSSALAYNMLQMLSQGNKFWDKLLLESAYPEGFAKHIFDVHQRIGPEPGRTLRQKVLINTKLTDRELFERLPLGDVWSDAGLADVFMYMLQSHSLNIPDSWLDTMMDFKSQLQAAPAVTRAQIGL
ncbi:unnamed protein product [Symbiodinium sp. CCMP2456]|nr:unnamed protein product [Symbiodinium sp. CCMP2456]